jgi:hypothetical protein
VGGRRRLNTFFDAAVRPVIDNDIREQIGRFRCVELVSSCSLVQNGTGATAAPPADTSISLAQDAVNESLAVAALILSAAQAVSGVFVLIGREWARVTAMVICAVNVPRRTAHPRLRRAPAGVRRHRGQRRPDRGPEQGIRRRLVPLLTTMPSVNV